MIPSTSLPKPLAATAATIVALATLTGCGGEAYEVAPVAGQVLIDGKPGHQIRVQFIPASTDGPSPPMSFGTTDSQGRFSLSIIERDTGEKRPGAVVGRHRVVLRDMQLAASPTGQGVPVRLPSTYTQPGSTPLTSEVTPGENTLTIEVPAPTRAAR